MRLYAAFLLGLVAATAGYTVLLIAAHRPPPRPAPTGWAEITEALRK